MLAFRTNKHRRYLRSLSKDKDNAPRLGPPRPRPGPGKKARLRRHSEALAAAAAATDSTSGSSTAMTSPTVDASAASSILLHGLSFSCFSW